MLRHDASSDRLRKRAVVSAISLFALSLISPAVLATPAQPEPFKVANIHFETNASDCDIGIQMSFDTDGITEGSVEDPNENVVYSFQSSAGMADIGGQSEGFLEGVEPQITELIGALGCEPSTEEPEISITELFAAWPQGTYEFQGFGGGVNFEGQATLSYHIPAGAEIVAPEEGAVVPANQPVLITSSKVTGPILPDLGPVQIVGYHVVVKESNGEVSPQLDVDVPKDKLSVTVPKQFLKPNKRYGFEVLATDKSGNQTITSGSFCTSPMANCEP